MKRNELFKRKTPGPRILAPALTPEQAAGNRALYEQEIGPYDQYATRYFEEFYVNNKIRRWLLPNETWRDLNDDQINYVCSYMDWFKKQIEQSRERQIEFAQDDIPFEWGKQA